MSTGPTPSSRPLPRRGRPLLWAFAAVCLIYALENTIGLSSLLNGERARAREQAEVEARAEPTEAQVLGYLDGESITPTEPPKSPGEVVAPLVIRKDAIEGLTLTKDGYFTLAAFTLRADRGDYAVEILLNHHPSDGMFVFDSYRVAKAARR